MANIKAKIDANEMPVSKSKQDRLDFVERYKKQSPEKYQLRKKEIDNWVNEVE